MYIKESLNRKIFNIINYTILILTSLTCLIPFLNVLAVSFSSSGAAAANMVGIWPIGFNIKSYEYVLSNPAFGRSFLISIERLILGVSLNMILIVLVAYPLSKDKKTFRTRAVYVWYFLITILFSGGLIPWYLTIKNTGLVDTIWALVIPGSLPVFSMVIMLNFFRGLPKELEEAAFIDGASHWIALFKIYVPLSVPSLATVLLFGIIGHWNSWFDGLMLMNSPKNYPLQTYLKTVVINVDTLLLTLKNNPKIVGFVNERTSRNAQLFIATIPILIVYPFLQKYFTKGLVLGSVKG